MKVSVAAGRHSPCTSVGVEGLRLKATSPIERAQLAVFYEWLRDGFPEEVGDELEKAAQIKLEKPDA